MQVHLIRSNEYAEEQFNETVSFLNSFEGPVRFIPCNTSSKYADGTLDIEEPDEQKFYKQMKVQNNYCRTEFNIPSERLTTEWENLFETCARYRKKEKIPNGELAILLTDVANEHNWFSAMDPNNLNNGFVHTGEWQHYVHCSSVFPVAYLTASLLLQKHMFRNYDDLNANVHDFPLGCINDFCEDKRNIILKLRTADICLDCSKLLEEKLEPLIVEQMLRLFEGVRLRILFNQNFRQGLKPSKLKVTKAGRFLLPDYGNIEIKLRPLEKTLYLFYLLHHEGVRLTHLADHKEELKQLYFRFTNTGELPLIYSRIDDLCNALSNSASEKISKIKKAFEKTVGQKLAAHYIIQGDHGDAKKILLEKEYQVIEWDK
jgi:hypothetical protein